MDAAGGALTNWSRTLERKTMPPLAPESTLAKRCSLSESASLSVPPEPTDFQSAYPS